MGNRVAQFRATSHIKLVNPLIWTKPTGLDHAENLVITPLENKKLEDTIGQNRTITNDEQVEIDEIDRQIAKILIYDSRISFRKIAKQLNISTKNVIQRHKKLRKNVLTLATITLDLKKLGYNAAVRIFLKVERSKMPQISDKILHMQNILVFIRLIGSYDLLAIAPLKDFNDYIGVQKEIQAIPGTEQAEFAIMGIWPAWPLNVFASLIE